MGFQSYEMLAGDAAAREAQRIAFLNGETVNPVLDYPKLDELALRQGIHILDGVLSLADAQTDPTVRDAVWDSASYRMAEMYWLLSREDLIRTHPRLTPEQLGVKINRTQELNELLYGKPEKAISDALVSEVWAQIDDKELVGVAAQIKHELEFGTTVEVAGERIHVSALQRTNSERLPQVPPDLLSALKEKAYADNPDIVGLIQNYWSEIVQQRPEGQREFTPDDMYAIFKSAHALRDPENTSGVDIIMDPAATALSWETPLMAVKVGGARDPIDNPAKMFAKVYHEYVVHGGRAVSGSSTALPVLGTGLFTDADPGEMSDYLTFEEGFASMCEMALSEDATGWQSSDIEKYSAITHAYEGKDFRQAYETEWRAQVLMSAKSGEELTSEAITAAQSDAYKVVVRAFRGTPTELPRQKANGDELILTFNKDLAYLKGQMQVIEFWKLYGNDPQMLDLVFKAKFDPLNKRQLALVKTAFNV